VRPVGAGGAVWLLAIGQTLTYAGVYYNFPALLPDLEAATGWSKGQLAAGPTLAFLVMAVLTPFTGRLVDRGWGGEMLVWLPVGAAAGVAALAFVVTPGQWLAVWFLIGIAQAGMLYESCFSFLTRRLGDGARAAITRVTLVAGFSGTLTFPLGHVFGQAFGGQGALLAFALVILLGAVPVNYVGVRALRRAERQGAVRPAPEPGALRVALGRVEFWAISLMFGLIWLNHGILLTYVLVLFQDRGASLAMATLAASCFGPAQVLGRLVLMMNEARTTNAVATLVSLGLVVVAGGVLLLAGVTPGLVFVVAVVQGAGVGLLSILRPVLVADILGRRGFGAVSGAAAVAPILASAAAPSVGAALLVWGGAGLVYDVVLGMAVVGLAVGVWLATGRRRLQG
jgi:MFS family permease